MKGTRIAIRFDNGELHFLKVYDKEVIQIDTIEKKFRI